MTTHWNGNKESDPKDWKVSKKQADASAEFLKNLNSTDKIKLLPLPEPDIGMPGGIKFIRSDEQVKDYTLANVKHHIDMLEVQLAIANEKIRYRDEVIELLSEELQKRVDKDDLTP